MSYNRKMDRHGLFGRLRKYGERFGCHEEQTDRQPENLPDFAFRLQPDTGGGFLVYPSGGVLYRPSGRRGGGWVCHLADLAYPKPAPDPSGTGRQPADNQPAALFAGIPFAHSDCHRRPGNRLVFGQVPGECVRAGALRLQFEPADPGEIGRPLRAGGPGNLLRGQVVPGLRHPENGKRRGALHPLFCQH